MWGVDYDQALHFTKEKNEGHWSQVTYPSHIAVPGLLGTHTQASSFKMVLLPLYHTAHTKPGKCTVGQHGRKHRKLFFPSAILKKIILVMERQLFFFCFQLMELLLFTFPHTHLLLFRDITDFLILFHLAPQTWLQSHYQNERIAIRSVLVLPVTSTILWQVTWGIRMLPSNWETSLK